MRNTGSFFPEMVIATLFFAFLNTTLVVSQPQVLICYFSKTGNTAIMAESVQKGAASVSGVEVILKRVEETSTHDLLQADAIIVGSPVYNANVAPEVSSFIAGWPFENAPLRDKLGAAFVTAGGSSSGEEITQMNILQSMMIFGMIIIGGENWQSPFGASGIVQNSELSKNDLLKGENLGKRVAEIALRLNPKE